MVVGKSADLRKVTVRVGGVINVGLAKARGICAGLFGVGTLALMQSALISTPSSVFSSFVVPIIVGALLALLLNGLIAIRNEPLDASDLPELLGGVSAIGFVGFSISRFLPRWTVGGWWAFAAAVLLIFALILCSDLLKARSGSKAELPH